MEALIGFVILLALVVALPLLLLKLFFGLLWALVVLPFKVLGAVLRGAFGLLAGLATVFGAVALALAILAGLLVVTVVLPLLPLFVLVGGIWLLVRASRRRPLPRAA